MNAADEAGVIRSVSDGTQLDGMTPGFQGNARATDRQLADAALTQAAAHDDALDVLPFLKTKPSGVRNSALYASTMTRLRTSAA